MNPLLALLLPAAAALAVAVGAAMALARLLPRWRVLDVPNARSSHQVPVPRGGGLAVLLGLAAAAACAAVAGLGAPPRWVALAGATALVAAVGLWDDLGRAAPWWARLLVHTLAAVWVVAPVGGLERFPLPAPLDGATGILAVPLAVVWVVALVNFVNFMDGIDGLAGLQMLALGLALAGAAGGGAAWFGLALAAACLGFLVMNWHPARLFLGDVGSGALGFLAGAAPFAGDLSGSGGWEPRRGVLLVAVTTFLFLADATLTLIRRAWRRERLWEAHRSHVYQRLVIAGRSHARVAAALGAGALLLAAIAVQAYRAADDRLWWLGLAAGAGLFSAELLWSRWESRAGS